MTTAAHHWPDCDVREHNSRSMRSLESENESARKSSENSSQKSSEQFLQREHRQQQGNQGDERHNGKLKDRFFCKWNKPHFTNCLKAVTEIGKRLNITAAEHFIVRIVSNPLFI